MVLGAAFLAIQAVPYGRDHDNPPVVADAPWPSAGARLSGEERARLIAALEAMDRAEGRDGDDRSGPNRGRGRDGGGSG